MAGNWRAAGRLARMVWHAFKGVRMAGAGFQRLSTAQQQHMVESWARQFLAIACVSVRVEGTPLQQGPLLLVANHQSWLDIPILHAAQHCRFISKSEVASWPIVGTLARTAGTLFIQRSSRRDTRRIVQVMVQALQQGDILAVFPEGTVSNGRDLLPFHGNMLQAAIEADIPVQAAAMRFMDADTGLPSLLPCEAYLDEPLWRSLWRTLRHPQLQVVVRYGVAETAQGRDRRRWALDLHQQVQRLREGGAGPLP